MKALLCRIAEFDGAHPDFFIELVNELRPPRAQDHKTASCKLLALCHLLEQSPELQQGLRSYLLRVLGAHKQSHLYADTGIFDGAGFFTELRQRLAWKLLPPAVNRSYLKDIFGEIFHRPDDWQWVTGIEDGLWQHLIAILRFDAPEARTTLHPQYETLESLSTLSHRLIALGLDAQMVRIHPAIEAANSPFLALNAEIGSYVTHYHGVLQERLVSQQDEKQALVLIAQCRDMLKRIRRHAASTGISIHLTQLTVRMLQTLRRMEDLLLVLAGRGEEQHRVMVRLFKDLVRACNRRFSLRDVVATHTSLLALRVTENAGRTGEHYVTRTRRGYFDMLQSGLGAGFVISFMALLKVLAGKLSLAPVAAAILYSLNYSLGFMLIHVLHFTVATKQPAMTAARIAASIEQAGCRQEKNLAPLADLCVNVFRTQFIATLGNVLLALPLSILLASLWEIFGGRHLASPAKVQQMLHDLDPIHSPALFYAAIAGVCLFLAGLVSGYYDNKAVYSRVPERLRQHRVLQRLLGERRLLRFSSYVENNLGALAGNFYFGLMLGCMAPLGFILGLPLDIRHITFSSAYFGFALVGSGYALPLPTLLLSLAGVAAIGLTNLVVSFSLALLVALRSRHVHYWQWLPLMGMVRQRFLDDPLRFFWPPRESRVAPAAHNATEEKKAA